MENFDVMQGKVSRVLAYKISLSYYSGKLENHYIYAKNQADAFNKAHRFCNPFDVNDGVQFITPTRITKQYIEKHNIKMEVC